MDLKIRRCRSNDFYGVIKLNRRVYREARNDPDFGDFLFVKMPSKERMRVWFKGLLNEVRKNDAVYLVAEYNGNIVGQCFVRRDTPGSELSHVGILSILVDKEYRNRGFGKELLRSAIKASRNKFEILHLRVFESNKIAKKLYANFGFRSFGIAPGFIKRNNRHINREYMYLKLFI